MCRKFYIFNSNPVIFFCISHTSKNEYRLVKIWKSRVQFQILNKPILKHFFCICPKLQILILMIRKAREKMSCVNTIIDFNVRKKKAESGLMDHLSKKYVLKTIWYMKLKFPGNHYIFKRYTIKVLCILEGRRLVLIWDLLAQCLHCAAWTQPHRFFKGPFDKEAEWWSVASDYLAPSPQIQVIRFVMSGSAEWRKSSQQVLSIYGNSFETAGRAPGDDFMKLADEWGVYKALMKPKTEIFKVLWLI